MKVFLLILGVLGLTSCSGPYMGKDLFGADEFVLDSYKIREGKFSILELEGCCCEELDEEYLEEYQDRIHEDDVLQIALYHPKRIDVIEAVRGIGATIGYQVVNGRINLPDLQCVEVAGLTLEEARQKIQAHYQNQIEDMEVFLTYKDRIVRKVELAGLVSISSVPVDGKIRLFDVLSKARVPTDANLFKSYVVREDRMLPVDLNKLLKEGDMQQNIVMRGNDKVYIAEPHAATLMVMGEVGRERTLNLLSGSMPLRQALAESGGIPYTGDKSYIQVIRGNICNPKIYTLNWEHVIHLPNDSLLLMPGDIVYVAAKPITEWNR
ncbi:MAG TPA: polysaccharide biosynthesis/export family protein, partial [Chlamydiales bacterium]|nr:polysaccharide biosynthesis/export family protein [Chlamydiales bacterium]